MIVGIGIDSAEVKRFLDWRNKSLPQLKKIFSEAEIEYCSENVRLSAQRFAVRFAAREAFFKALCCMMPDAILPFLSVCKAVHIKHDDNQIPVLHVNWPLLIAGKPLLTAKNIIVHVSLTHTNKMATAVVVLETI